MTSSDPYRSISQERVRQRLFSTHTSSRLTVSGSERAQYIRVLVSLDPSPSYHEADGSLGVSRAVDGIISGLGATQAVG